MITRRHSPLAVGIACFCLFATSGAYLAIGQQFALPEEDFAEQEYRQCMMMAVEVQESEYFQAYQQYHQMFEEALGLRWQEKLHIWEVSDEETRDKDVRELDREFDRYDRDIRKERNNRVREAQKVFSSARRTCRDQMRDREEEIRLYEESLSEQQNMNMQLPYGMQSYSQGQYDPYQETEFSSSMSYQQWQQYQQMQQYDPYQQTEFSSSSSVGLVPFHPDNPVCGDGICEAGEYSCAQDCMQQSSSAAQCNGYTVGQTFGAQDGCNKCICTQNGIACTRMDCSVPAQQTAL